MPITLDTTRIITAQMRVDTSLIAAKEAAHFEMMTIIAAIDTALVGTVPQSERDSWSNKATAARAVIAGSATEAQTALLDAECAGSGERPRDLAQTIIDHADAYDLAAATAAGLRRQARDAIVAATTEVEVDAAMAVFADAIAVLK